MPTLNVSSLQQEIDGETLETLANGGGSVEQLNLCGLRTVKQQLQLMKLLVPITAAAVASPTTVMPSTSGKLMREEMKKMTPKEKCIYLIKLGNIFFAD